MRPISTFLVLALAGSTVGCKKESEPAPKVRINELVASNQHGLEDNGTYPDWLELYNAGSAAVDLSGWFLTDDLNTKRKWEFPRGTKIGKGDYLVVICDSDENEPGLHTNFDLRITGESVGLFGPDGDLNPQMDAVTFGPIASDYAWAVMPDEDEMVVVWPPTPGEENRLDEQPPGGAP